MDTISWESVKKAIRPKWSFNPEWCCQQLRFFMGDFQKTPNRKLAVVHNYLTSPFFQQETMKHGCIIKLRLEIVKEKRKRSEREAMAA
jgi:hypothetical protein